MTHVPVITALVLLCLQLTTLPVRAVTQHEIENKRDRLEQVTEKIRQQKEALSKVEKKEARLIASLSDIERDLSRQSDAFRTVSDDIARLRTSISDTHKTLAELSVRKKARQSCLAQRLTALYKYYRRSGLRILLSADSYNDFLKRERFLTDIVASDRRCFDRILATVADYTRQQTALEQQQQELLHRKQELSRRRDSIKAARSKKAAFLDDITRKKNLQKQALEELEQHSRDLQRFLDTLPDTGTAYSGSGKPFSSMKGKLMFPVGGEVITRFGRKDHPELHTFTFQKGIEIRAPHGTPIKAVHHGQIVFSDWFKGYGYMIIVDHGDSYYSLSAHASQLLKNVNDVVRAGETIALVGDTNSIKGDCLYFEIRHHGKPQNPLSWLKKGKGSS